MSDRHFEDLQVGDRFVTRGATISESQILDFAWQHDPQPFHIDREAAADWGYGGLIASGFQTLLVSYRLFYQENVWSRASLGSPGIEQLRWVRPVRPGDTLHVVVEIIELRASDAKPDRGYATLRYRTLNQRDEAVMSFVAVQILRRRVIAG